MRPWIAVVTGLALLVVSAGSAHAQDDPFADDDDPFADTQDPFASYEEDLAEDRSADAGSLNASGSLAGESNEDAAEDDPTPAREAREGDEDERDAPGIALVAALVALGSIAWLARAQD